MLDNLKIFGRICNMNHVFCLLLVILFVWLLTSLNVVSLKDSVEENQQQSSPHASSPSFAVDKRVEDIESVVDRIERPSPVSVLEPLFTEDDISPASIKSKPGRIYIEKPMDIHYLSLQFLC